MDEIRETNVESNGASDVEVVVPPAVPVVQTPALSEVENAVPMTDSVSVSAEQPVPAQQQEIPVVTSSGGVSVGDTWTNEQTSFRVVAVTPVGGVSIRFRTQETLEGSNSSFIRKVKELFEKKKKPLPHGEWFFGSGEEIQQFIEQDGYQLEKRKEEEKESVKAA